MLENLPRGQPAAGAPGTLRHRVLFDKSVLGWYLPGGQHLHDVGASPASPPYVPFWYWPSAQLLHERHQLPVAGGSGAGLNFPLGQKVQLLSWTPLQPSLLYIPGLQMEHDLHAS
jgi:hypothetical protein